MTEKFIPIINLARCDHCGKCISICPVDALVMAETGPVFAHPAACTYCADCEAICPQDAIRAPMTVAWAPENNSSIPNTN